MVILFLKLHYIWATTVCDKYGTFPKLKVYKSAPPTQKKLGKLLPTICGNFSGKLDQDPSLVSGDAFMNDLVLSC